MVGLIWEGEIEPRAVEERQVRSSQRASTTRGSGGGQDEVNMAHADVVYVIRSLWSEPMGDTGAHRQEGQAGYPKVGDGECTRVRPFLQG